MIKIQKGWKFNTADFSLLASGQDHQSGRVSLIREPSQKEIWHEQIAGIDDEDQWPELLVQGRGFTLEDAIDDANKNAKVLGILSENSPDQQ